jgi:hypothetical protein
VENLTRANKVPLENIEQPFKIHSMEENTVPLADDEESNDMGSVPGTEAL